MATWLIRTGGADTNGGTSATVRSTGTDGIAVTGDLTKFSSISAAWGAGDVGHGIYASSGTISRLISAVQVAQSVATAVTASGLTTFTSAALFNATMLHCAVSGPGIAAGTYISAYTSTSSMTLSAAAGAGFGTGAATLGPLLTTTGTTNFTAATGQTWNVGGAFASWTRVFVTASGGKNVVAAADSIYVGAGVYRTTVANTLSGSAGNVISIIGDVDGAKTGDAGQVTLSAYTTNDTTVPSASILLALATTTNLSFSLITFIAGSSSCVTSTAAAAAANYTFTDCTFNNAASSNSVLAFVSSTTGLALGITLDRCTMLGYNNTSAVRISLTTTASGAADWDALCLVRNCLIINPAGAGIYVIATLTNTFNGGGVRAYGNTVIATTGMQAATALHLSTTVPCEIHNSVFIGNTGITAATAGQITGSYNDIYAGTPETNYTYSNDTSNSAGTGTYAAPLVELGQSYKWAGIIRQFLAPDGATSPLVGAGSATFSGNYPVVDWANRPRPTVKAVAAVGYSEVHDFSIRNTGTVPTGQTTSAAMTGPGDTDIWVPVDAVGVILAVQLYQNAGYTGTTYATAQILANGEIGVVAETKTCISTLSSWQTLTFTTQTPTAAGWVKVRITSYDTSGTGVLYFGALTAT